MNHHPDFELPLQIDRNEFGYPVERASHAPHQWSLPGVPPEKTLLRRAEEAEAEARAAAQHAALLLRRAGSDLSRAVAQRDFHALAGFACGAAAALGAVTAWGFFA